MVTPSTNLQPHENSFGPLIFRNSDSTTAAHGGKKIKMIDDEEAPSYHKKLANMNNVKEKINLKKIEKKFEKMKNDKFAEYK